MLRTRLVAGAVVGTMVLVPAGTIPAAATAAQASGWITNKPIYPGMSQAAWDSLVGPTAPEWQPQGRKVAGLKFNPKHDGFFFFNYVNSSYPGSINLLNTYLWETSSKPVKNLGVKQLVNIFGRNQVCVPTKNARKKCVLTNAAETWRVGLNNGLTVGHCFGIATTAAKLYSGMLTPRQLGGKSTTHSIPFKPKATRMIAQNDGLQTLVSMPANVDPKRAYKILKKHLKANRPMVLNMYDQNGGGHAVTPIGLYKRGKHKYDIAIYDSNYPDRVRAIHADTSLVPGTKQQVGYDYQLLVNQGVPPSMLVGNIALTPLSKLSGQQVAPFNLGSEKTVVAIEPNTSGNRMKVKITTPEGKRIKGLKTHHPTGITPDPNVQSFPEYTVPKGAAFKLEVSNADNAGAAATAVRVFSGGVTAVVGNMRLPGHSVDSVIFRPKTSTLRYHSTGGTDAVLMYADKIIAGREVETEVQPADLPAGGGFTARFETKRGTFSYQPTAGTVVEAEFEQRSLSKAGVGVAVVNLTPAVLPVSEGGSLRWNYLKGSPQSSTLTVDLMAANGSGTAVKLQGTKIVI